MHVSPRDRRRNPARMVVAVAALAALAAGAVSFAGSAAALPATVNLGDAASFAVLGGTEVTNVGLTTVSGDVGVSPGTLVSGFPPGVVTNGNIHINDGPAAAAQAATTTAYLDAAGRPPGTVIVNDTLGGLDLVPGVYDGGALDLTGNLILRGTGDPDAVFIIRAASTLTTAANSTVTLIDANPCNVFWQVTSSAALGSDSAFVGTILALTSITVTDSADINGRLLARNGNVTLINDNVTNAACGAVPATTTTTTLNLGGGGGGGGGFAIPTTTTTTRPTTTTTRPTTTTTRPTATTSTSTTSTTAPTTTTSTPAATGGTTSTVPAIPTPVDAPVTGTGGLTPPTPPIDGQVAHVHPPTATSGTPGTPTGPELPRTGLDTFDLAVIASSSIAVGAALIHGGAQSRRRRVRVAR